MLNDIIIHDFRNYARATAHFSAGINVLMGSNGIGKSNLLEAVLLLSLTKSPRAPYGDQVRWGESHFDLTGSISSTNGSHSLQISVTPGSASGYRKQLHLDETRVGGSTYLGHLPSVSFFPGDLAIVQGSPSIRRQMLDMLLVQHDYQVRSALLEYRRALEQKNRCLTDLRIGRGDPAVLDSYNFQIATHGALIQRQRQRTLALLGELLAEEAGFLGLPFSLSLNYQANPPVTEPGEGSWDLNLRNHLAMAKREEIARGVALVGPHRDEVAIMAGNHNAKIGASQGQQRTIVLAMALVRARYLESVIGRDPILLLDDLFSELDARTCKVLTQRLITLGYQAVITGTEWPTTVPAAGTCLSFDAETALAGGRS